MKWAQDMEALAAKSREILERGNPRKMKIFQKIPYAGDNRRQNRKHTCQENENSSLKKEE